MRKVLVTRNSNQTTRQSPLGGVDSWESFENIITIFFSTTWGGHYSNLIQCYAVLPPYLGSWWGLYGGGGGLTKDQQYPNSQVFHYFRLRSKSVKSPSNPPFFQGDLITGSAPLLGQMMLILVKSPSCPTIDLGGGIILTALPDQQNLTLHFPSL